MTSKNSPFVLYKTFIDAYMKGHPEVAKCLRHYNALAEWNKIKTNEELIKSNIEKYVEKSKNSVLVEKEIKPSNGNEIPPTNTRKRTISSDDESEYQDPLFDPEVVTPVEPTFSKRIGKLAPEVEDKDETKPWVQRGIEKAKARLDKIQAKIDAKRLARVSRPKAPAQDALAQEIKDIADRITNLIQIKNMGLSTEETNITLKKLIRQKKARSTELSLLQSKQRAGLRYRARRKKRMESLCTADPEVATELLKLYKPSTLAVHSIEDVSPDLLHTIEEIARVGGVSNNNSRYSDTNSQPCTTLDELRDKIKERNFEIRRSSLFYRLIPAGAFSEDGKKHVNSTNVRLRKIQGIEQAKHPDCHFVSATLKHIKDLAGTFGNDCVFYLVQDNKASVRIGRPAVRGHSPLMLRMDYQISTVNSTPLPASVPYQLKPTVYASCIIDETGVVTNAGPTYISIRSVKHDRINIDYEEVDFDQVVKLKEFEKTARNHIGEVKPIIIMNVDTINPMDYTRYPKTLYLSIKKFKTYNLDAFILVTQAPGQTAFNMSERRLALLSQDLSGLVLPHDYFGTHLNISGLTNDADVEKANFKKTGEILSEIWNMNMIDRHPVFAEYLDPPSSADDMVRFIDAQFTLDYIIDEICDEDEEIPLHQRIKHARPALYPPSPPDNKPAPVYDIDEYWCATHVFQTQYTIQIIRCTKTECCGPWRSNYIQVFPHRFLPPPVPFNRSSKGVRLADITTSFANSKPVSPYYGTLFQRIQFHGIVVRGTQNTLIPFDAYCPSVQENLQSRICSICKQYVPSPTRLRNHYRVHQQRYTSKCIDLNNNKEEEFIDEIEPLDPSDLPLGQINLSQNGVCLFYDMSDWLKPDFEEDHIVEPKPKSIAANAMAMIRKEKQLVAEATAALAQSSITINKQPPVIEPAAEISVDNALSTNEIIEIKTEHEDVSHAIEQLNVSDDRISDSYDDLSDLIEKI